MPGKASKGGAGKLSSRKAGQMLQDIFEAKHDLAGLAEVYGLKPTQLASWANDSANREVLGGLCVLADLQTQLMLSRYRQLAVTELIRQATGLTSGDGEGVSAEQARKACVDLLRADLKPMTAGTDGKAQGRGVRTGTPEDAGAGGGGDSSAAMAELEALRATLYRELTGQTPLPPEAPCTQESSESSLARSSQKSAASAR